jgi:hypothetical protein
MKSKIMKINISIFRYLLFLPLFFLTFCQSNENVLLSNSEGKLSKDSKVLSLMKEAIGGTNKTLAKSGNDDIDDTDEDQCTNFKYPMTFYVFFGDNPIAEEVIVNSDEELLAFFDNLTNTNGLYIIFPITLIDVDGVEIVINDLTELEGTLQMAVDACHDGNDDGNNDNDDDNDDDGNNDHYKYCDDNHKKVSICHNGHTICVSVNAIWGHLNQHEDDYLGTCN